MTVEIFVEWLRRQGIPVHRGESGYWHRQGPRALQAFPYHGAIIPDESELRSIMRQSGAMVMRYSTPLTVGPGALSYQIVLDDRGYSLDSLGKWARKNVRRGLRNVRIEPINWAQLDRDGAILQAETAVRQNRRGAFKAAAWSRRCSAAATLLGFEAWGALGADGLEACLITARVGDWYYMLSQACRSRSLAHHPNNALAFEVTRRLITRADCAGIFYSLHSLDAPASMDQFKLRMGYVARPVRQRVVFASGWGWAANSAIHALLRAARRLVPASAIVAKAEGMVRFYRQGLLPLHDQPQPLAGMTTFEKFENEESLGVVRA